MTECNWFHVISEDQNVLGPLPIFIESFSLNIFLGLGL